MYSTHYECSSVISANSLRILKCNQMAI